MFETSPCCEYAFLPSHRLQVIIFDDLIRNFILNKVAKEDKECFNCLFINPVIIGWLGWNKLDPNYFAQSFPINRFRRFNDFKFGHTNCLHTAWDSRLCAVGHIEPGCKIPTCKWKLRREGILRKKVENNLINTNLI